MGGIYFIENIEMSTAGDLFHWKWLNKVWLRIYFIEKKFTSLELLKEGTAGDLFY